MILSYYPRHDTAQTTMEKVFFSSDHCPGFSRSLSDSFLIQRCQRGNIQDSAVYTLLFQFNSGIQSGFNHDSDGDTVDDSDRNYPPYSHGRPTVHNNGANVSLLDGHVERVAFKKLWAITNSPVPGSPVHSFWKLDD